jgi:hypothetical protein
VVRTVYERTHAAAARFFGPRCVPAALALGLVGVFASLVGAYIICYPSPHAGAHHSGRRGCWCFIHPPFGTARRPMPHAVPFTLLCPPSSACVLLCFCLLALPLVPVHLIPFYASIVCLRTCICIAQSLLSPPSPLLLPPLIAGRMWPRPRSGHALYDISCTSPAFFSRMRTSAGPRCLPRHSSKA